MKRVMKAVMAAVLVPGMLLASSTFAADTSVSPQERAKIEGVVKDYLMKNPEVIVQAVQELQKKQYQKAEETIKETQSDVGKFRSQLFDQSKDPIGGNKNGTVTIAEFFDYQCIHCIDMAPVMDAIVKANPNVRVVFKEFPIRGPISDFAARAALAAEMQGKYYPFHQAMLTAKKPLTEELIIQLAKDNGIDVDKMKKDMDSATVKDMLKANMKLGQDLKLFGTPALFIGKTNAKGADGIVYIPGQMSQDQLQQAIDKASK